MIADKVRRYLEQAGYRIAAREEGFVTVLVSQGAERWLGSGPDEEDALADAVTRMFPSGLAEELLFAALDAFEDEEQDEDEEQEKVEEQEEEPEELEEQDGDEGPDEDEEPEELQVPEGLQVPEEIEEPEELEEDQVEVDEVAEPFGVAEDPDSQETLVDGAATPPAPPPEPDVPPPSPRLTVREALEQVEYLQDEVDDLLAEVAWTAPPQVRIQLTAWLARARAIQQATGHADRVEGAVRRLAGRLGAVTKRWWPGYLSVLQLHAVPADVNRKMELGLQGPLTWAAVADALEASLDDLGEGWADDAALDPRPNAVDATFEAICSDLEALLGPLHLEPSPGSIERIDDASTRKALGEWARRLRWMRGVAPSGERWASAMGHLRWVAQHVPATRRSLDPLLDPEKGPREGTWARALGEDPEKRRRQRRVRAVLRKTPGPTATPEEVASWLAEALTLGADLTNRQVMGLVPGHADTIRGFANEDLGDVERNVRSRLRKLKKALDEGESAAPPPTVVDDEGDGAEDSDDDADPVGDLVARVRDRVAGKKAVFVSNRKDTQLKDKLEERLGLDISWCSGSPRRVQSVGQQVASGTYDYVILATGFAGHSADAILGKAASTAGVPFVRAYKGRPLATLRALARDLGIRREGEG